MRGGVIKLSFAQVFNKFYSFYEELENADQHGCKDKDETEQAVTSWWHKK